MKELLKDSSRHRKIIQKLPTDTIREKSVRYVGLERNSSLKKYKQVSALKMRNHKSCEVYMFKIPLYHQENLLNTHDLVSFTMIQLK